VQVNNGAVAMKEIMMMIMAMIDFMMISLVIFHMKIDENDGFDRVMKTMMRNSR